MASKAFGSGYLTVPSVGVLGLRILCLDRVSMGWVDGRCGGMVEAGGRAKGGGSSGEAGAGEFGEDVIRFSVLEDGLGPGCIGGIGFWFRDGLRVPCEVGVACWTGLGGMQLLESPVECSGCIKDGWGPRIES